MRDWRCGIEDSLAVTAASGSMMTGMPKEERGALVGVLSSLFPSFHSVGKPRRSGGGGIDSPVGLGLLLPDVSFTGSVACTSLLTLSSSFSSDDPLAVLPSEMACFDPSVRRA